MKEKENSEFETCLGAITVILYWLVVEGSRENGNPHSKCISCSLQKSASKTWNSLKFIIDAALLMERRYKLDHNELVTVR